MREIIALSSRSPSHGAPWKEALRQSIRDPAELLDLLGLSLPEPGAAHAAMRSFPLLVPRDYVARMRPGDPADPLLRQVLPLGEELQTAHGYSRDPTGDGAAAPVPGLLRKYGGRALLVVSRACAVHCRYCFRRHGPAAALGEVNAALKHLAGDGSVHEVILSGGDPLVLEDAALAHLAGRIAAIDHVRRLRIHTRIPVVLPQRITPRLLDTLRGTRLVPVVVLHANHPAELRGACAAAIRAISSAGIVLLNQSVLLRGVNDDAATLAELSEELVALGAVPYYLHALDRVEGAAHFEVSDARGLEILAELRRRLPGYAVPRFVREVPGADAKQVVREVHRG